MNVLRLGVVVFCFGCLIYAVATGTTAAGPMEGFSSSDFQGPMGLLFWMAKMLGYAFLIAIMSMTFWLVCSALNIGTDLFGKIANGIKSFYTDLKASVEPTKETTSVLDQVIARDPTTNESVTVRDLLKRNNRKLEALENEIKELDQRTSHIEPPPPPKTKEEELEEQNQILLERLQALEAQKMNVKEPANES